METILYPSFGGARLARASELGTTPSATSNHIFVSLGIPFSEWSIKEGLVCRTWENANNHVESMLWIHGCHGLHCGFVVRHPLILFCSLSLLAENHLWGLVKLFSATYHFDPRQSQYYYILVMELCEGGNLQQRIDEKLGANVKGGSWNVWKSISCWGAKREGLG